MPAESWKDASNPRLLLRSCGQRPQRSGMDV